MRERSEKKRMCGCVCLIEKLKIALYQFQREIHTVATGAAPGELGLKSHSKDYYGHPSKYKLRPTLLNPNVLGG